MWIIIVSSVSFAVILMLPVFAVVQKQRRKKIQSKEVQAIKGIGLGIGDRLHAACPDTKWRWVCRPAGFALNGGIARIEVIYPSGTQQFMDVCLGANGYMALHVLDVAELAASSVVSTADLGTSANADEVPGPAAPNAGAKPHDEESVTKWYNIVLINALNTLIEDLNADGEVCVHIDRDGKAYVEDGGTSVVYDFGEMPDVTLWGYITEKLGAVGLFAEVQEEKCIFISWA